MIDDEEFANLDADSLNLYTLSYQNSVVYHEDEKFDIESLYGNYEDEALPFRERMHKMKSDRKIVNGFTEMARKSLSK